MINGRKKLTLQEIKIRIDAAKKAYYNSGDTIMSDYEYDKLVEYAERLGYIEAVGSIPASKLPEIEHEHLMLSLDKVHSIKEVEKFVGNLNAIAMYKMDGLTCSATYEDGVLTRLETRGNGVVGNDIMVHAKSFENLPLTIDKPGKYVVDGECIIRYTDFDAINDKLPEDQRYKNPRNLAAGSLNLLDPRVSAGRHLRFYVWDVLEGYNEKRLYLNLLDAAKLGFSITPFGVINDNAEAMLITLRDEAVEEGIPIDGIVIKYDDVSMREKLGCTQHHFLNAVAYKFEDERYETKLRRVDWTQGKTGQLTPVAVFDPVEIDGTEVSKASMHNVSVMRQLHPMIGATCYIYKANSIIPQVYAFDEDEIAEVEIPTKCPICGQPTLIVRDNQSEVLMCKNPNCAGKLLGKLKHFVSKNAMDIDGLSEATLQRFISLGLVSGFSDLFFLSKYYMKLINLEGFGKKSADKLLKAIEESKHGVKLENFINALSIPGIGLGQARAICRVYPTWDAFFKAAQFTDLSHIEGIGKVLNESVHDWFDNVENLRQVGVLTSMIDFADCMNEPVGATPITGLTFVVTGAVEHFKNRDELKKKIEGLGGKCVGSVSKKTDYLINNDVTSTSGKNQKARELGVKIISEEEFIRMCEI